MALEVFMGTAVLLAIEYDIDFAFVHQHNILRLVYMGLPKP